jgi:hypothetical protein
MLDVPAHIQYAPQTQNGALVVDGSNWDVSRGAAALPVRPAPVAPVAAAPEPIKPALTQYAPDSGLAGREPVAVMTFAPGAAKVDATARKELCKLPKSERYEVAGHAHKEEHKAETLATSRATSVSKALKLCGLRVTRTTGYGSTLVAPTPAPLHQRRVEIFRTK